jgi:hypothetical protein
MSVGYVDVFDLREQPLVFERPDDLHGSAPGINQLLEMALIKTAIRADLVLTAVQFGDLDCVDAGHVSSPSDTQTIRAIGTDVERILTVGTSRIVSNAFRNGQNTAIEVYKGV